MLDSFLPQHTPDLAHPLFASIVGLLEVFLFLIESFEVGVFCDNGFSQRKRVGIGGPRSFFPDIPRPDPRFFRSPLPPAMSSPLFSSCVPFRRFLTVSLFPPLVGGNSRRPRFPIGVRCNCR